ncbi:MAG: hypothetical protein AAGA54_31450 [Myxococcota bacterium]
MPTTTCEPRMYPSSVALALMITTAPFSCTARSDPSSTQPASVTEAAQAPTQTRPVPTAETPAEPDFAELFDPMGGRKPVSYDLARAPRLLKGSAPPAASAPNDAVVAYRFTPGSLLRHDLREPPTPPTLAAESRVWEMPNFAEVLTRVGRGRVLLEYPAEIYGAGMSHEVASFDLRSGTFEVLVTQQVARLHVDGNVLISVRRLSESPDDEDSHVNQLVVVHLANGRVEQLAVGTCLPDDNVTELDEAAGEALRRRFYVRAEVFHYASCDDVQGSERQLRLSR